jgi:hypothetical protein
MRNTLVKKLPKVNFHPMGENSPNLVTLQGGGEEITENEQTASRT